MKAWGLQFILLPKIRWDFMVYEFAPSFIKKIERQQNIFLRKWLGLHRNLNDIALCSKDVPCPLPFESLVELFNKTMVGSLEQLTNSTDAQVAECAREQRTGK